MMRSIFYMICYLYFYSEQMAHGAMVPHCRSALDGNIMHYRVHSTAAQHCTAALHNAAADGNIMQSTLAGLGWAGLGWVTWLVTRTENRWTLASRGAQCGAQWAVGRLVMLVLASGAGLLLPGVMFTLTALSTLCNFHTGISIWTVPAVPWRIYFECVLAAWISSIF